MAASAKKISRNSPCPCGSGLKYKQCCAGKRSVPATGGESSAPRRASSAKGTVLFVGIIAFSLATLAAAKYMDRRDSGSALPPPRPAAAPAEPTPTPQPWFHDLANNRHWHAPHGHWHPGPPPPKSLREAAAAMPISPAPGAPAPSK